MNKPQYTAATQLLSIQDVCAATRLGKVFIYGEIRDGRLRSLLCGRRRLVTVAALAEYIAAREAATNWRETAK